MDLVQCLKLFDRNYEKMFDRSIVFASTELGWKITVPNSILTTDPNGVWHELVRQIQLRLLVLKHFRCEATEAPEVLTDEEPEWDVELVPEIWKW